MTDPSIPLSRRPDFLRFWAAEAISLAGSEVTALALPLAAALQLGASPGEMGLLGAASFAPYLLLTLPAGAWIDRHPRRRVLIWSNLGRAGVLSLVPAAAWLGLLGMPLLYAVGFAVGVLTVFFDLAHQAFVPSLAGVDELTNANSRLQATASTAEVAGPGVAGLLVQLLTAPVAIVLDVISYLAAALALRGIRHREAPSVASRQRESGSLLEGIAAGLRLTFGDARLRALAGEAATFNLFSQVITTMLLLYATRDLGLDAAELGVLFSIGAVGSLLGAVLAGRFAARFGVGRAIVTSMGLACAAPLLLLLPVAPGLPGAMTIAAALFFGGVGVTTSNVYVVTLRQTITPPHLLGRMNASYRTVVTGAVPIGALLAGVLGEAVGVRGAIAVAASGLVAAPLWVLASPVARLRTMPAATEGPA